MRLIRSPRQTSPPSALPDRPAPGASERARKARKPRLADPAPEARHSRRKRTIEEIWSRIDARLGRRDEDAAREREAALSLLALLACLPTGQQLERVEGDPRFWTLGLVEALLDAAASAPERSVHSVELALALVLRLDPARYGEPQIVEQEVIARSLRAEAHRRSGDLAKAEVAFRAAARRLAAEPLDSPGRALYCRNLARLRSDQGWADEAHALLQRAADLFEEWLEPVAAGEALAERGRLYHAAADPVSAQPVLEQAILLLQDAAPAETVIRAWYELALCRAEIGQGADAGQALTSARALYGRVPDGPEKLRLDVMEARLAGELGWGEEAAERLTAVFPRLLAAGAFHDAAVVALDLAELWAALDRPAELERLREQGAPLFKARALPEPACAVLLFGLRMARRRDGRATELVAEAREFLERARESPALRFRAGRECRAELSWDQLDTAFRRLLCTEAGVPLANVHLAAGRISPIARDLISWTYEELAGTRIDFAPVAGEPRERGWTWV